MSSEKCNQILGRYPSSAASSTSRLSPPSTTTTATHQTWWHDNNSPHHTENRSIRPRLSTSSDNSNIHHNRTSFYSYPYSSYLSNSASSLAAYNTTDPLPPGSGSNSTSGRRTPTALTSTTTPIAIPIPPIIASFIGSQRKKLGLTMISSSFASSSISTSSASSSTRQQVHGQKRQERQQQQQQQQKSEKLKKKEKVIEREKEKEKEKKAVVPFLNSYSPHPRYRRDSMDLRGWCSNSYDDYNTHYRDLVTPSDGAAVLSTSAASSNYSTSASSSNSGSGSGFPIQQQQQQQRGQQQQQKSLPPLPPSYSSSYSSSSSPPSRRPQPIEHSSEKEVVVSGVNSSTSTSSTSSFLLTSSGTTRTSTSTKSTSTTKSPPPPPPHHHHQKTPSEKNNNNAPYDITATPYNYKKTYEIRAGEKNPSAPSKQNSNQQQQNPPGTFTAGPAGGAGLEIHQNGRAIWWVRFQTSFWGAPGIFIEGLPVVLPRMGMDGGKGGGGGGGGGGKGKLGGKRRVLAVSFDFFFFFLSICFPFLPLFSFFFFFFFSYPSYFFSLSFCFIISFQRQNKTTYTLSPLYPLITNIFHLPLPPTKTGHKIQIRPFRILHPPRRPLRTQHPRRTLASSDLQQLERKRVFFRISRSKIRLEEVQSIPSPFPPPIKPTNPPLTPSLPSPRSPVTSLLSYLKDTGDYHLLDVDNPGHLLAAYLKDRDWFAFKPIAKMEFYVKLEQGLELMALAAVMGVEERRRRKNAAAGIGGGG